MGLLLLFVELLALALMVLGLHRISTRLGLGALLAFLGCLALALAYQIMGVIIVPVGQDTSVAISQGPVVILPAVLLGLLLLYVVNGTRNARSAIIGIMLVVLALVSFKLFQLATAPLPVKIEFQIYLLPLSPFGWLASSLVLLVDMGVLILVYQWACNWRGRYPSRLAIGIALLAALWSDALLYPLLTFDASLGGGTAWWLKLGCITLAALLAWLLAVVYLSRAAHYFPESEAASPRPVFDILNTSLQLETRARHQYNLLRILSRTGALIISAQDPHALLEQACQMLAEIREYRLVWVAQAKSSSQGLSISASAGPMIEYLSEAVLQQGQPGKDRCLSLEAYHSGKTVVVQDVRRDPGFNAWQDLVTANEVRSAAALPMRHGGRCMGVLSIYSGLHYAFTEEEIKLLQELADTLAYALNSLDMRRQQMLLHAAAQTMRDGLVITDQRGHIIYVNPVIAETLGYTSKQLEHRSVFSLLPSREVKKYIHRHLGQLETEGQFTAEIELADHRGEAIFVSLKANQVRDPLTGKAHSVISLRDITSRYLFERRLVALYGLSTDLAQIYNPEQLLHTILHSCETLLGANTSAVFTLTPQENAVKDIYVHKLPESFTLHIRQGFDSLFSTAGLMGPLVVSVDDLDQPSQQLASWQFLLDYDLHAMMVLPVSYRGELIGVLGLFYHKPVTFTDDDRQLGQTIAHTVAIALQNTRLYAAERSQRRYAEAMAQAAAVVNSSLDLDIVLNRILEQTIQVIPCRSVNIMLVENETARVVGNLEVINAAWHRSEQDIVLPLDIPTLRFMIETGQPLYIPDILEQSDWVWKDENSWIRSYVGAPLQVYGLVIGFLSMNSDQPAYFDRETPQRVKAFADAASIAIQNARLYHTLEDYANQLEKRVQQRTAELRQAKEDIEAILASVPDAVFVIDSQDRLQESNQAGAALLAQAGPDGLFDKAFLDSLRVGALSGEKAVLEVQGRAYQALASPLYLGGGRGLVIVFRDVTRFRELDQMKTRFVSDVSHELRTPLTNLTIYLDLLADAQDPLKRQNYLATLKRENERLTQLIENLLMISRLEAGRVQVNLQPVDVSALAAELVHDRAPMAARRSIHLVYNSLPLAERALADPRLLSQVLSNLMTNALNYTSPGGLIQLRAELEQHDGVAWVAVSIIDNGAGISADEINHIFERFFRGKASQQTGAPGTGLGLAISKEIIERMGGQIGVKSAPGLGSTFTVRLKAVL